MGREEYTINEKINLDKLDWLIKVENTEFQKLFCRLRYSGHSVKINTEELGFAKSIGYKWQNQYIDVPGSSMFKPF